MKDIIENAAKYIEKKVDNMPKVALILGSGLGVLAEEIENAVKIPYQDIPDFPVSTVSGHAGQLVLGNLEGSEVLAMQGRFHYYEGYSMEELTLPVRVMKNLGIDTLIVTNAAGGVNKNFWPGEFMIISDHINMMGDNPLIGMNLDDYGPRFPDMSEAYSKDLISLAEKVASDHGIITRKGVYAAMSGPSYETPAEIRFLAGNGIDAVGMSTVPEVIVASHMNLKVLGISCITNMAAGILPQALDHSEVVEIAEKVRPQFITLIRGIIKKLGE
ncbi:purine-nucleoside phosphorylase [Natronospora cellulosivora (SeqCode)]